MKWLLDKKYVHEKELESNHCAKNLLQCRILKASSKTDVNGAKSQKTAKYIQYDAWATPGTNSCNGKTGIFVYLCYNFFLIKTEYLQLFMGFKNQKQKHVFSKTLKVKTLFSG